MSNITQNFLRRIEKIFSGRPTVPIPGTNHVDDTWQASDIYPGELSLDLPNGKITTTDGNSVIILNAENSVEYGLVVSKPTSGADKIGVSSGLARINGKYLFHDSSGTDVILPGNSSSTPILYFIYGSSTQVPYNGATSGNLTLGLNYIGITGNSSGTFSVVSNVLSNSVAVPADSIILGSVFYPGATSGINLFPDSVGASGGGAYINRLSAVDYILSKTNRHSIYATNSLYFEKQLVIDSTSNIMYLAKATFVSSSVANDVSLTNLVQLA